MGGGNEISSGGKRKKNHSFLYAVILVPVQTSYVNGATVPMTGHGMM